jgi:hypothetical protein
MSASGSVDVASAVSDQRPPHMISKWHEPHRLIDRIIGKLLFLTASPALIVAMRRRRRSELWIGDSHAMALNRKATNSMFCRGSEGQLILRAGPRLMYSLARNGFPPRVMRVARFVNRFGRPGSLVPVFVAGEIDLRAHLPKRPDDPLDWIADYVDHCVEVARLLKADRVGFFVTPPPVDVPADDIWFPIIGTIEERVAIHRRLRAALADGVSRTPNGVLIDLTETLARADGAMPVEFTYDGVHTNEAAVARVRAGIAGYQLLAR